MILETMACNGISLLSEHQWRKTGIVLDYLLIRGSLLFRMFPN